MIVVDTNILAYLYISHPCSQAVEKLLLHDPHWCAPILWRSELKSVLSLYLRKSLLGFEDCLLIFQQAEDVIGKHEYNISASTVLHLIQNSPCSSYDCEFIALAQKLQTPLITSDKKILTGHPETAQSVEDYLETHSQN